MMLKKLLLISFTLLMMLSSPSFVHADSGGLDLDGYCRSKGYVGVVLVENNAYGWSCKASNDELHGMDLYDACKWQYGGAMPIPKYGDFNNPYSWQCYSDTPQPAPAPNHQPPASQNGGDANSTSNNPSQSFQQSEASNNSTSNSSAGLYYSGSSSPPNSGDYVRVEVAGLRIRTGAGTNYTILGHVMKGNYYPLLESSGDWGKIQTNRGNGWVSLNYVSVTTVAKNVWCSITPQAENRGGGSWTNRNYVLVYRGPNLGSKMGSGKEELYIYYNNKWIYLDYHGYFEDENIWGISTRWAYVNRGWNNDSRWRIDFLWEGQSCP